MTFCHTSSNVKMLRNILIDFEATAEITPFEYMQLYIKKCPAKIDDSKLTWIVESFLSIQKHKQFLNEFSRHFSEELTEEEQDYFIIIFHAVTFQVEPKDMDLLFKTLFNLSKNLLSIFTNFLSNNEMLTYISEVAIASYDSKYVTEKIVSPLFIWQPYISEMAHNYASYIKKVESRKLKPLTVPVTPNFMNRKSVKDTTTLPIIAPATPPNSAIRRPRRTLTRSALDRRLQNLKERNKQKAENLLNSVKNADFHFALPRNEVDCKKRLEDEIDRLDTIHKPKKVVMKTTLPPIRENATLIKRYNKRKEQTEQEEIAWLNNLMSCCKNLSKFDEMTEIERREIEKERLYDIERKHVLGLISFEEAVLAKKNVQEQNKKKYEGFMKDKQMWNEAIENWKRMQIQKNRDQVEKLSMMDLNIIALKNEILEKKKTSAAKQRREAIEKQTEIMKARQEELEKKIKMMKEIRVLSMIARKARLPKVVDLTETAGLGLLCEMSIAELQERIVAMRISIKEELERKKELVKSNNEMAKKELEVVKDSVQKFLTERESIRKINVAKNSTKQTITLDKGYLKEIENLKNKLQRKKNLRLRAIQEVHNC